MTIYPKPRSLKEQLGFKPNHTCGKSFHNFRGWFNLRHVKWVFNILKLQLATQSAGSYLVSQVKLSALVTEIALVTDRKLRARARARRQKQEAEGRRLGREVGVGGSDSGRGRGRGWGMGRQKEAKNKGEGDKEEACMFTLQSYRQSDSLQDTSAASYTLTISLEA